MTEPYTCGGGCGKILLDDAAYCEPCGLAANAAWEAERDAYLASDAAEESAAADARAEQGWLRAAEAPTLLDQQADRLEQW